VPLAYFHSPFVVYAPGRFESKKIYQDMGSQIDVYPTIMGLIQEPYTNNTLGIDLLKEKRTYAIINNNDKVGILDTAYFCIMGKEKTSLYHYKQGDKTDYYDKERQKAEEMSEYAKAFLQTYQEVLLNKQTFLQNNF
jgi:phosphoglycerol transferase MdoB-like AlkP superfamily enzyme